MDAHRDDYGGRQAVRGDGKGAEHRAEQLCAAAGGGVHRCTVEADLQLCCDAVVWVAGGDRCGWRGPEGGDRGGDGIEPDEGGGGDDTVRGFSKDKSRFLRCATE